MRRLVSALALSSALVLGGCQNPDGSLDVGNTLLLGAGVVAAAALVAGAASSNNHRHYASSYGYHAPSDGYGYGRGYGGAIEVGDCLLHPSSIVCLGAAVVQNAAQEKPCLTLDQCQSTATGETAHLSR